MMILGPSSSFTLLVKIFLFTLGKASKAIRKEKTFNQQKKLILNFLEKRLSIRELPSLISKPGDPKIIKQVYILFHASLLRSVFGIDLKIYDGAFL